MRFKKYSPAIIVLLILPLAVCSQNFGGNVPSVKWYQVNTPKAKVIFPAGLDSQANRIANEVMLMDSATSATIGGHQRKWNIVLQTQTTIPNAYVRMAPLLSELNMIPGQDNFGTGSIRWDDNLITHESRHMQQFSNFNKGLSKVFSVFLGQDGQLFANALFLPDYFFEGDAVWQETLVSAQGRGRMPSFLNGFRALWMEQKKYPWMKYRSGSLKDFVPDHYPIGYVLTGYGYEKYGSQFWNEVTEDAVRFTSLFNKAVARHSSTSFMQFKDDAIAYFKEKTLTSLQQGSTQPHFITPVQKNNVVDYMFPNVLEDGSIVVTKKSYKSIAAFYVLRNGKEEKLVVKKPVLDDYYSTNGKQIVYASFQTDARWANRDYSVLQVVDIASKQQKQITFRSKYFSPDINNEGTKIIAVDVHTDGTNNLIQLDAATGAVLHQVPNPHNYFFTQTKFIDAETAISAVRNPDGTMALVTVQLSNGTTATITPFSFNVLGYPYVKGDTVYYSKMDERADNVYAVLLSSKKIFRITSALNGLYHPVINSNHELVYSAFTASGYRLGTTPLNSSAWQPVQEVGYTPVKMDAAADALQKNGAGALYRLADHKNEVTRYRKSFQLFNFHSWRPVVNDPEYGYSIYSDNILTNFSNILSYTYNYSDRSHTVTLDEVYSGWFPRLTLSLENSFNRTIDTAVGKSFQYNAATVKGGADIPLSFVGGRTSKYLDFGASYNLEQYYYRGVGKDVFSNKAIDYVNTFLSFSNVSQQARQHINPRWAQAISLNYRDAFTYKDSHKFVGSASLYFPGFGINHSLVITGAIQRRDTLADLFSNNFPYARGYEALSTRQMYKWGVNYHFPVCYPDGGIGGLVYFLRIRANAFYDYNNARARVNGTLTNIINRSTGGEIYFDTKVWNSLPVTIGVRCSHLLDTDLLNPAVKNRWEIILPVNLIPN
ncbi:MAG: hypothetical protein JST86_11680 [Bacteroidetes bacterium]|nr:hypothetical protein [Bacteroidota bacterium]